MGNTGLMSGLIFKGTFDALPKTAKVGDAVMVFGRTYIYVDDWYEIDNTVENTVGITEIKKPPKNCPNCGGIINPYKLKCEFCGTYYW